jgi:signal transduction histidine kinase
LEIARRAPQIDLDAARFGLLIRLADDLAHEIKNPLHSMVINLEVLKRRVEKGAADGALERAEVLGAELNRLHQMVEALLRLIRGGKPSGQPNGLRESLENVLPLVAARFRLARVDFSSDEVPEDVYSVVPEDALSYALLAVTEHSLKRAREFGGAVRLTCGLEPQEIVLGITQAVPATAKTERRPESVDFATALLEPCGAQVDWRGAGGGSREDRVVLRIPRTDYRIENRS